MIASFCRRSFLNYKNCLFQIQKRTEYVVLIPETPEEISDFNMTSVENLPDFAKLNASNCKLLISSLAQQYEIGSYELEQNLKSQDLETIDVFKQIFKPLEILSVPLLSYWGVTKALHFSNWNNIPRNVFNELNSHFLQVWNKKFNSVLLYSTCKNLLEKNNSYTDEQKRILNKFVWEGFLNGFEIEKEKKTALVQCCSILESKRKKYEEKIKYSKMFFKHVINDENFAKDCPLDLLRNTSLNRKNPLEGPWVITLNNSVYNRFLEYCESRESRKHIWLTYNQLGSSRGDSRMNVVRDFKEILKKRQEYANHLGFETYAHLAVKNKMAGTVENVRNVLSDILESAKRAHEKEINELERFAYENNLKSSLEMWDFSYWKRLHLKYILGVDEIAVADYFPFHQVLLGLISLCEHLFGIVIEEQPSIETWDSDVCYFRILDAATKNVLGGFYLDPYAREGKHTGENNTGWLIPIRSKSKICNSLPLSALIFSFNPPTDDRPSLLYFRDVTSLFDKFGQLLQHTLTEMNYSEVTGMANLEWDTLGTSRHFLRFWLHERGTLESISGHFETGEPLSTRILENLSYSFRHMAATKLCHLIYLSNLDLELHLSAPHWKTIYQDLWPKHLLFRPISIDCHPLGFQDIISGPWASSFYSEIWSTMLAADCFIAFEEVGFRNQEEILALGKRFRSTYLSLGGGCDPKEVFRRFRGRDPDTKSLKKLFGFEDVAAGTE